MYIFMQLFSLLCSPFLLPCFKSWQKSTAFKIQIEKCPWLNTHENIKSAKLQGSGYRSQRQQSFTYKIQLRNYIIKYSSCVQNSSKCTYNIILVMYCTDNLVPFHNCGQMHSLCLGDIVESGIVLSYRPAMQTI